MPIKFVNHLDNKTVQEKNIPDVHATPNSPHYDLHCNPPPPPPSAAASGTPPQSTHRPKRSANMLREIHEYQIKAIDFVMLMCCYSKLRFDVLLISWHLRKKTAQSSPHQSHINWQRHSIAVLITYFDSKVSRREEGTEHLKPCHSSCTTHSVVTH